MTSQIFANIYFNEFDRFVKHRLKPLAYLRYGDDFIFWVTNKSKAVDLRKQGEMFLNNELSLTLHEVNDVLQPAQHKLHFLGMEIWPSGHRLDRRMHSRIEQKVTLDNLASYRELLQKHGSKQLIKQFTWESLAALEDL